MISDTHQSHVETASPIPDRSRVQFSVASSVFAPVAAIFVILPGLIGLIGNLIARPQLFAVVTGLVSMKMNTSLGLILAGIALACAAGAPRRAALKRVVYVAAAIVCAIASTTLVEYIFNVQLGLDELFIRDPGAIPNTPAGRMAVNSAVCLLLTSAALLIVVSGRWRIAAQLCAFSSSLLSLLVLVGYLFSSTYLHEVSSYTPMAMHTAFGLTFLAVGILCLPTAEHEGVLGLLNLSPRVVLPVSLLFTLLFGGTAWFWHQLQTNIQLSKDTALMPLQLQLVSTLVLFSGSVVSSVVAVLILALFKARSVATAERQLAAIVESSDDAIISYSLNRTILSWNRAAQSLFGYSSKEAIGRSLMMLIPEDEQSKESGLFERVAHGQYIEDYGARRINKYGSVLAVASRLSPVRNASGTVIAVSDISRDVSERLRFIEELERSNAELQRFAYVASHDLQTPLRSIVSFTELLKQSSHGKLSERETDWLRRVVDNGQRMQLLVQDLLAYTKVESGPIVLTPVELSEVLKDVKENLFAMISESGATITGANLPTVEGDRSQLLQLLQNLISNAIKYRGDATPHIEITSEARNGSYLISVRDNGIGIAPEHQEKIFELFQRLHNSRAYPGTGIGLAICRRIVEHHGGKIWVESKPGHGSNFFFTLRRAAQR